MTVVLAWSLALFALPCPQNLSAIPPSQVSSADLLDRELEHVDPRLDGWDTEVLSSRAGGLIGELAQALFGAQPITPANLPAWVSGEMRSTSLRPEDLTWTAGAGGLRLARGSFKANQREGRAAFAQSLNELRVLMAETQEPHAKVKVVRVIGDPPVTELLFRIWGERSTGERVQSDAIWSCNWERGPEGQLKLISLRAHSYTESAAPERFYKDCSEAVMGHSRAWQEQLLHGTDEWCARIELGAGMDQYSHHGLTLMDIDGDELEDIYVCQPGGLPNLLLRQKPDGTVEDLAARYGLDWLDNTKSALWVDLDGDGQREMVLSLNAGIVVCKQGDDERYAIESVLPSAGGYSLSAVDYDGDGWLDLFVCQYATADRKSGLPAPYHDANNGPSNNLYRNLKGLRFKDVTDEVGLGQNNTRFSFAASWADYDGDGDPDLYVANDFGRNCLYRNEGGQFEDVAAQAGVEDISAGMGVSWGDYDGDGWLDLYVSNMFSSAGQRIAYQRSFKAASSEQTRAQYQRHARGNSLFRNRGDGTFEDVAVASGTWMGRWAWGAGFVDFDNDGDRDLFVPNGFITNESTNDL